MSKRQLLMLGAGTLAAALARTLEDEYELAFLDDCPESAVVDRARVIGGIDALETLDYREAIAALGDNARRPARTRRLRARGYRVPVLIHPTAFVAPTAALGPGCIVRAHAVIDEYATLGAACLINIGAMIDHHCALGDGVHAKMGCVARGQCKVEALRVIGCHEAVEA